MARNHTPKAPAVAPAIAPAIAPVLQMVLCPREGPSRLTDVPYGFERVIWDSGQRFEFTGLDTEGRAVYREQ